MIGYYFRGLALAYNLRGIGGGGSSEHCLMHRGIGSGSGYCYCGRW